MQKLPPNFLPDQNKFSEPIHSSSSSSSSNQNKNTTLSGSRTMSSNFTTFTDHLESQENVIHSLEIKKELSKDIPDSFPWGKVDERGWLSEWHILVTPKSTLTSKLELKLLKKIQKNENQLVSIILENQGTPIPIFFDTFYNAKQEKTNGLIRLIIHGKEELLRTILEFFQKNPGFTKKYESYIKKSHTLLYEQYEKEKNTIRNLTICSKATINACTKFKKFNEFYQTIFKASPRKAAEKANQIISISSSSNDSNSNRSPSRARSNTPSPTESYRSQSLETRSNNPSPTVSTYSSSSVDSAIIKQIEQDIKLTKLLEKYKQSNNQAIENHNISFKESLEIIIDEFEKLIEELLPTPKKAYEFNASSNDYQSLNNSDYITLPELYTQSSSHFISEDGCINPYYTSVAESKLREEVTIYENNFSKTENEEKIKVMIKKKSIQIIHQQFNLISKTIIEKAKTNPKFKITLLKTFHKNPILQPFQRYLLEKLNISIETPHEIIDLTKEATPENSENTASISIEDIERVEAFEILDTKSDYDEQSITSTQSLEDEETISDNENNEPYIDESTNIINEHLRPDIIDSNENSLYKDAENDYSDIESIDSHANITNDNEKLKTGIRLITKHFNMFKTMELDAFHHFLLQKNEKIDKKELKLAADMIDSKNIMLTSDESTILLDIKLMMEQNIEISHVKSFIFSKYPLPDLTAQNYDKKIDQWINHFSKKTQNQIDVAQTLDESNPAQLPIQKKRKKNKTLKDRREAYEKAQIAALQQFEKNRSTAITKESNVSNSDNSSNLMEIAERSMNPPLSQSQSLTLRNINIHNPQIQMNSSEKMSLAVEDYLHKNASEIYYFKSSEFKKLNSSKKEDWSIEHDKKRLLWIAFKDKNNQLHFINPLNENDIHDNKDKIIKESEFYKYFKIHNQFKQKALTFQPLNTQAQESLIKIFEVSQTSKKTFIHHLKQSKQQEDPNKRFNFILNIVKSMNNFQRKTNPEKEGFIHSLLEKQTAIMQSIFESTAIDGESLFFLKHESDLVKKDNLFIMDSVIEGAGKGVFAQNNIEKNAFLGVMTGKRVPNHQDGDYVIAGGDFTIDAKDIPKDKYNQYDTKKCEHHRMGYFNFNDRHYECANTVAVMNHNPYVTNIIKKKIQLKTGEVKVGFFAKHPIKCGTELIYDYGNEYDLGEAAMNERKRKRRDVLNIDHFRADSSFYGDFATKRFHK